MLRRLRILSLGKDLGSHRIDFVNPPSTSQAAPVTKEARSEARKTTMPETSSGVPKRFSISTCFARFLNTCLRVLPTDGIIESASRSQRGVWISAGHTQFTRILSGARSIAIVFE